MAIFGDLEEEPEGGDPQGAQQAEHSAGCPDHRLVRRDQRDRDRAAERADQVQGQKPHPAEQRLERARTAARNDPKMVANLIKDWMGLNEEARK